MTFEATPNKRAERLRADIPNRRFRTALANGSRVLEGVDGRSHVARRYRELAALISRDVSPDADLTEAQRQLIRSAAGLVVLRERLDVLAVKGEQIDAGEYCAISNTLRRVLVTVGLGRTPRDLTDESLRDFDEAMAELEQQDANASEASS
jgi:hypothetical protein